MELAQGLVRRVFDLSPPREAPDLTPGHLQSFSLVFKSINQTLVIKRPF